MGESKKYARIPFARTFLLDLLIDREARPILLYAGANVLVGAALYHWLEGWSWLDSVYFTVIALTTIGFGDFAPTMPVTKLFTIFFALNGVAILLMLLDEIRRLRTSDSMVRNATEPTDVA